MSDRKTSIQEKKTLQQLVMLQNGNVSARIFTRKSHKFVIPIESLSIPLGIIPDAVGFTCQELLCGSAVNDDEKPVLVDVVKVLETAKPVVKKKTKLRLV